MRFVDAALCIEHPHSPSLRKPSREDVRMCDPGDNLVEHRAYSKCISRSKWRTAWQYSFTDSNTTRLTQLLLERSSTQDPKRRTGIYRACRQRAGSWDLPRCRAPWTIEGMRRSFRLSRPPFGTKFPSEECWSIKRYMRCVRIGWGSSCKSLKDNSLVWCDDWCVVTHLSIYALILTFFQTYAIPDGNSALVYCVRCIILVRQSLPCGSGPSNLGAITETSVADFMLAPGSKGSACPPTGCP
jgi:hypothetical protein